MSTSDLWQSAKNEKFWFGIDWFLERGTSKVCVSVIALVYMYMHVCVCLQFSVWVLVFINGKHCLSCKRIVSQWALVDIWYHNTLLFTRKIYKNIEAQICQKTTKNSKFERGNWKWNLYTKRSILSMRCGSG